MTILDLVTSIGASAFSGCSGLTAAYFLCNAPPCTINTFDNYDSGFTVYYVSGKTGWTTPMWCTYSSATITKAITTFTIPGQIGSTTIGDGDHSIALTMPSDTTLSALAPTIIVSAGASVNPASLVATDFTSAVTYTVTAVDISTQEYIVTVTNAVMKPTISTGSATSIMATTAILHGNLVSTGGADTTVAIFSGTGDGVWNRSDNFSAAAGPFSFGVTGLAPGTTYHYQCYAKNSVDGDWSLLPLPSKPRIILACGEITGRDLVKIGSGSPPVILSS